MGDAAKIWVPFTTDRRVKELLTTTRYSVPSGFTSVWPDTPGPCTGPFLQYTVPCDRASIERVAFRSAEFSRLQWLMQQLLPQRPGPKDPPAHRLAWTMQVYTILSQALDATNVSPLFLPNLGTSFLPMPGGNLEITGAPAPTPVGVPRYSAPGPVANYVDPIVERLRRKGWNEITMGYPDEQFPQFISSWLVPSSLWLDFDGKEKSPVYGTYAGTSFAPVARHSSLNRLMAIYGAPLSVSGALGSEAVWNKLLWLFDHENTGETALHGGVVRRLSGIAQDFQRHYIYEPTWTVGSEAQVRIAEAWGYWLTSTTLEAIVTAAVHRWTAFMQALPEALQALTPEAAAALVEADSIDDLVGVISIIGAVSGGATGSGSIGLLSGYVTKILATVGGAVGTVRCPQFPFKRDVLNCQAVDVVGAPSPDLPQISGGPSAPLVVGVGAAIGAALWTLLG